MGRSERARIELGLPKGRMSEGVLSLLKDAGIGPHGVP